MSSVCIILYTVYTNAHTNFIAMTKAFMKLHRIKYEEVNGSALEERERRNELFDIAIKQGGFRDYPAYFVKKADGTITFMGHLEHVQDLIDADAIEESILKEHPEIVTFTSYFKE